MNHKGLGRWARDISCQHLLWSFARWKQGNGIKRVSCTTASGNKATFCFICRSNITRNKTTVTWHYRLVWRGGAAIKLAFDCVRIACFVSLCCCCFFVKRYVLLFVKQTHLTNSQFQWIGECECKCTTRVNKYLLGTKPKTITVWHFRDYIHNKLM